MNKVKKLTVALLVLVIGLFAGFTLVACGSSDEGPKVTDLTEKATLTVADVTYGQTPTGVVTYKDKTLVEGTDYTIDLGNYSSVNAEITATVTFMGKYKGSVTDTYAVTAYDASGATFTVADITIGDTPTATVTLEGFTLVAGTDYDVNFGTYSAVAESVTATVTFKGNFTGTVTDTYAVATKKIARPVADETEFVYTGKKQTYTLAENAGYTISGNLTATNAGTEEIAVVLNEGYEWADGGDESLSFTFTIAQKDASNATFTVNDVEEDAIPAGTPALRGFTFIVGTDYDVDYGDYTTPGEKTATVTFKGNYTGKVTATYVVKSFADNIEAFLDFNGNINNAVGGDVTTSMDRGAATYVEGVNGHGIKINPTTSTVKLDKLLPGTESYTISFDLNMSAAAAACGNNNFQILDSLIYDRTVSSTYFDRHPSSFEWGFRGNYNGQNTFRIQAGRNDGDNAERYVKGQIQYDTWQNWTLVIERNTGYDATKFKESEVYTSDGMPFDLDGDTTDEVDAQKNKFYTPEKVTLKIYLNGVMVQTKDMWYSDGQSIGFGSMVIGGQRASQNYDFMMDNFVFYRGVLTENQITTKLPAWIAEQSAKTDWAIDSNVNFTFKDLTAGAYSTDVAITSSAADKDLTGATLVDAPAGITLVAGETAGAYKLNFSAEAISALADTTVLKVNLDGDVKTITVYYASFNQAEADAFLASMTAYYDFDGNTFNYVTGQTTPVVKRFASSTGDAKYADNDTAFVTNKNQRKLELNGLNFGTDSFVVSALINGYDLKKNAPFSTGHSVPLFGTTDTDATDGGFMVGWKRSGNIRLKLGETWVVDDSIALSEISDDYARWTFVVDRETEGKVTFTVYIDGKKVLSKTADSTASADAPNSDVFGIGNAGKHHTGTTWYNGNNEDGTADIRFGDFALYQGTTLEGATNLDEYNLYLDYALEKLAWTVSDVTIDNSMVADPAQGATIQLPVAGYKGAKVLGATLVEASEEITLIETDGAYSIKLSATELAALAGEGKTYTLKYGDVQRTFKLIYVDVDAIYVDVTDVQIWSNQIVDGNFVVSIGVYADEAKAVALDKNVAFGAYDAVYNKGVWVVEIPASAIASGEAIDVPVTFTVGEVEAKSVKVQRDLTNAEYAELKNAIDVYMPLNGTIKDYAGHATKMGVGTAKFVDNDSAIKVTTGYSTVKIENQVFGTGDFALAFDLRVDSYGVGSNAAYEIVTNTMKNDGDNNVFQLSWHDGNKQPRIQTGRNDGAWNADGSNGSLYYPKSLILNGTDWYNVIFVVDRYVAIDEAHTTSASDYNNDGAFQKAANGTYSTTEKVTYKLYVNGVLVDTKIDWLNPDEALGDNALYLGGSTFADDWATNVNTKFASSIKNFAVYKTALTDKQITALGAMAGKINEDMCVGVEDVVITGEDTEVITAGEVALNVTGEIAEIKGLPEGVAYADGKLTFTAEALANISGTYTAVMSNGVENLFTVTYVNVASLNVASMYLGNWDVTEGVLNKNFTVTLDAEGKYPYGGAVDFGALAQYVTAGEGKGEYVLSGAYADIVTAYGEGVTISALDGTVTGALAITFDDVNRTYLVDDTAVQYTAINANKVDATKGRKYENVSFGTQSFTISVMVDDTYFDTKKDDKGQTVAVHGNGGYGMFGTGHVDGTNNGFFVYYSATQFRLKAYGTANSGYGDAVLNTPNMSYWHNVTLQVEVTAIETGYSIKVTNYLDYVKVAEKEWTADASYSADWKNEDGTFKNTLFVGCANKGNGEYNPAGAKVIGTANVIACQGVMPIEAIKAKVNATTGAGYADRAEELNATQKGSYGIVLD